MNQQTIQSIETYTQSRGLGRSDLYFNPGTYIDADGVSFTLLAGESIWGKMGADEGYHLRGGPERLGNGGRQPLVKGAF